NRLQRSVRSAEKIIGANLPTIQDLYTSRVRKRAGKITAHHSTPGHKLFKLLPSGRRYRSLFAKTYQKQFLPPRRLNTEQLTHCSIYIYIYIFIPALLALSTSSLHYCCATFHSYCI